MLKLYDKKHNAIGHIVKYKDCKTEGDVADGDKSLSFIYLAKHHSIENEMYIRTRTDEYVVKEISESSDGFPQIVAALNLEELEAKAWGTFSVKDVTIDEAARLALAGTGWTVGKCDVTKRRNAGMVQVNSLGVIKNLCTAFMCEPVFDTLNKTVSFFERRGEDRGVYFLHGLNLKKLQKRSMSYDFYTRIIPIGAENLTIESVNDGKNYLENFQYSDKVRTYIWKDESYTDAQALKEDAEKKLEDMSKPEKSYAAEIRDLAKQKPEYSILSFGLGDTVTLIDADTGTREKQRIVRMTEYEADSGKNTCEIANTFLTFEELQERLRAAADIINYAMTSDGKIYVSDILNFENGIASSVTVSGIQGSIYDVQSSVTDMQGELAQVKLTLGQVETNYLTADEAAIKYATIENLDVTNETVHSIQGDYASFKTITTEEFSAQRGIIDNLSGQFSSFQTSVSQELITAKGWMLEGAIGSAQISNVAANKLTAGTIDTAIVTIAGTDGRMQISDNTIQIKDANRVRVQAGKDASGDYTLAVWDASGNLIWDALGATEDTIQRKIIRDRMVADDAAIQALKLDLQSFNAALTNQGVTISGTVVQVGDKTLNIALSEQTQTISDNYTSLKNYTDTAKSAALSAAATDATTKANNALNSAKSYADAGIAGIDIGGRNLLLRTKENTKSSIAYANSVITELTDGEYGVLRITGTGSAYMAVFYATEIGVEIASDGSVTTDLENRSYLFSVDVRSTVELNINPQIRIYKKNSNGTYTNTGRIWTPEEFFEFKKAENWSRYECTIKVPELIPWNTGSEAYDNCVICIGFVPGTNLAPGQYFDIRRAKLEKGTKATDWTPAPEDIESDLALTNATVTTHTETLSSHDTRITASENAIRLKVSTQDFSSYQTTVTGQISTAKSEAISTAASDATTKANNALADSKTYTNAQITTVNQSLSTTNQEINIMKGQIELKVEQTDIETAMTSLKIGGRNLILDSKRRYHERTTENCTNNWLSNPSVFIANSPYGISEIAKGGTFTISFDYEITGVTTTTTMTFALESGDGRYNSPNARIALKVGDNSGHIEQTFIPTSDQQRWGRGWLISGLIPGGNAGSTFTFTNMKLEKGTKATDWTPAPEDIDASITAVDNKFANYSTTTQMQSAIDIAKDSITSSVSQTYATKSEVSTVSGKVTSLESWKSEASQKITKDGIIDTVGNYYAYQSDLSAAENRITSAESTVAQHSGQIAMTVKKDGIISAINQSAEEVKIQATKITLEGATIADSFTATNLHITGDSTFDGILNGATGTFEGDVTTSNIIASGGIIGQWAITNEGITKSIGDYDVHVLPGTNEHKDFLVVKDRVTGKWPFYVHADGELYSEKLTAINATISGNITADTLTAYENIKLHGLNWFGDSGDYTVLTVEEGASHFAPNIRFGNNSFETVIEGLGVTIESSSLHTDYRCDVNMYSAYITSLTAPTIDGVQTIEADDTYIQLTNLEHDITVYFNSGAPCIRPSSADDALWDLGQSWSRFRKLYASSGVQTTSDERDKTIIGTLDDRHKKLFMGLVPITFKSNTFGDNKIHFGLGAQTTERTALECGIPENEIAAIEHGTWDEPGRDGRTDRYGMNYDEIHMLTIPVVQEHERLLASHGRSILETETRVLAGEGRLDSLQEQLAMAREQIAALNTKVAWQEAEIVRLGAA